ncbi:hypothetical protein MMC09_006196 [Bachmanniomyces sp. S44760]|nr:hypothetical protein [Bachmanniomyces sp. S44760]
MWTLQTNLQTRQAQFQTWSSIILSYCREKRIWRLTLVDALNTPLFHNVAIRRKLNLLEVREVIDWMTWDEAGQRAQWVAQEEKGSAWIYWRRPEEWAEVLYHWVEETGQKNSVLTLYELSEGEGTMSQDFRGMDPEIMQKSLNVLVKRGKAQVFGGGDEQGVKFF